MRADPEVSPKTDPLDADPRADARVFTSPIGSRRVEATLGVAMSIFGVLFTLQSVPAVVSQWRDENSPVGLAIIVLVFGSTALAGLAALLRQSTRAVFFGQACAYLIALAMWPGAPVHALDDAVQPWPFLLANVAVGFLTISRRDWILPGIYSVLTCALIGYMRTTPYGGNVDASRAILDATYILALDGGLIVLIVAVRQAARTVDAAQAHALSRYAAAQHDQATEHERVKVDALVHDRVLTTFISAARAFSPEAQQLTAGMARSAMAELSAAQMASIADEAIAVPLAVLVQRIRAEAAEVGVPVRVRAEGVGGQQLPGVVSDALYSAAAQALVNSVRHAGDASVPRTISIRGFEVGGVSVIVDDQGSGFDLASVSSERLGVRVSIVERMRAVGGEAIVDSAPSRGTRISLAWPLTARTMTEEWANRMAGELVE